MIKLQTYRAKTIALVSIAFMVRLFHVTEPPIEVSHNWRQTTSLMVARNFYQSDNNILYPTLDEYGEKRGVVGMEFPALCYSIYVASDIFGYEHWYGRLINLIIVSIGTWFFFRLISLYFTERLAFWATLAFCFSSLFHLARKVLPDPMSLSLVIIGLYYGCVYLREGSLKSLVGYLMFAMLGTLVKIPFGIYLALLILPLSVSPISKSKKFLFAGISVMILAVVYWWYFVWNIHLSETFGTWYNSGKTISDGFEELKKNANGVAEKFYFSSFQAYLFFLVTLCGIVYAFYKRNRGLLFILTVLVPFYAIYLLKSGFLFAHHGYYALVFVPLMALFAGFLLDTLPTKWAIVICAFCIVESLANQQHDFFIHKKDYSKLNLENIANEVCLPNDLVALVSNDNPNEFYFLNRKGWMVNPGNLNTQFIGDLKERGCRFLFMKVSQPHDNLPYTKVFETHEYIVFGL